jgi:hypothetical protein
MGGGRSHGWRSATAAAPALPRARCRTRSACSSLYRRRLHQVRERSKSLRRTAALERDVSPSDLQLALAGAAAVPRRPKVGAPHTDRADTSVASPRPTSLKTGKCAPGCPVGYGGRVAHSSTALLRPAAGTPTPSGDVVVTRSLGVVVLPPRAASPSASTASSALVWQRGSTGWLSSGVRREVRDRGWPLGIPSSGIGLCDEGPDSLQAVLD